MPPLQWNMMHWANSKRKGWRLIGEVMDWILWVMLTIFVVGLRQLTKVMLPELTLHGLGWNWAKMRMDMQAFLINNTTETLAEPFGEAAVTEKSGDMNLRMMQ